MATADAQQVAGRRAGALAGFQAGRLLRPGVRLYRLESKSVPCAIADRRRIVVTTACVRTKEPATSPTPAPSGASLWANPANLQSRDLFYGEWGAERAPNSKAVFNFVERKHSGVNPGMTVVDPKGREWSVKQIPPGALDLEARVEVTLSRL